MILNLYFLHYYQCGILVDEVKKKMEEPQRHVFERSEKVKKSRSGDGQECAEIYTGKWIYYKPMLFLKDTMTPRDTEGNISEEDQSEVEESNENIEHIPSPVNSCFVSEFETDSHVTAPSTSSVLASNISNDSDVLLT